MANAPIGTKRTDCVLLCCATLALGCLLLPAIAQSNSRADEAICLKQMKDLAFALHAYHDVRKTFPLASTQPIDHRPGSAVAGKGAGYSWLAQIITFLPERPGLYDKLVYVSNKLQKPAFSSELMFVGVRRQKQSHPSTVELGELLCPSFVGGPNVVGKVADYPPFDDGKIPAVATYHAFAGTHFENLDGDGRLPSPEQIVGGAALEGNGAMPFPGRTAGRTPKTGVSVHRISDAAANTFLFAESNERAYAAWIDGQAMWLVAAWPDNPALPTLQRPKGEPRGNPVLQWNEADKAACRASINLTTDGGQPMTYLPADRWSGTKDRKWGASSNHPGVVGHAFADSSAAMVSIDIDATVYLHLASRAGREHIAEEVRQAIFQPNRGGLRERDAWLPAWPRAQGSAVEQESLAWSTVEWSPIKLGDLRLRFPDILDMEHFRWNSQDRDRLTYTGKSKVFGSFTYDRKNSEFELEVLDRHADMATAELLKQLRKALGSDGTKDSTSRPKRVVWRKNAEWPGESATFEFALIDSFEGRSPRVTIRILDWRETKPQAR